jgi:hypothetical protein
MTPGLLFEVLGAALKIWQHKESRKYLDKYMKLKRDYYEEANKDPAFRSDAELDRLEFELRLLGTAFAASVGKPDAPAQPGSSGV